MTLSDEMKDKIMRSAAEVRLKAYAPYSNYQVGAALLTRTGEIFVGANVENAAYPVTMCAERAAVFSAVSAGKREFVAIAVATQNGGTPCGSCRQVLSEFGLDIEVLLVDSDGNFLQQNTVRELLPGAFQSKDLEL